METVIEPQDNSPFLDKDEISNKAPELSSPVSVVVNESTAWRSDFFFRRTTYYWIALISQFCHLVLCTFGYIVVAASKRNGKVTKDSNKDMDTMLFSTAMYSIMSFGFMGSLLVSHYGKIVGTGKKLSLAGVHHSFATLCTIMNTVNCATFVLVYFTFQKEVIPEGDVLPAIIPLMLGFLFVAAGASFQAGRITYRSAVSARGTESVPDPDYRVPAWTLATTEESQIYRRSSGSIQLPV